MIVNKTGKHKTDHKVCKISKYLHYLSVRNVNSYLENLKFSDLSLSKDDIDGADTTNKDRF